MTVTYKTVLTGMKDLQAMLAEMPDRVQNRVFRHAGRKVGQAVANKAMAILKMELKKPEPGRPHRALRESYINKQVVYRASATTVNIVGGQTGRMGNNHVNHLVELGTKPRWTGSQTEYVAAGRMIMANRKVTRADGSIRTIKQKVLSRNRKSIGSKAIAGRVQRYRGVMPAYHQLKRASDATPTAQIWEQEVIAGLQRIADRAAKAG
jgi:hypothetical protein